MKQPMQLLVEEYATVVWQWTAPTGTKEKDLLAPEFWQHVAQQLRPGHEVKVVTEDRTLWVHLLVRNVRKNEAVVAVIQSATFKDAIDDTDEDLTYVKWHSPKTRYGVFRKSDNVCLRNGFETEKDAKIWAMERDAELAA